MDSGEFGPGREPTDRRWGDTIFRYCLLQDLETHGVSFDGAMLSTTLRRVSLYWGLFNTAALIHVRFEACVFPGTSFRGCSLVDCVFVDCRFTLDNLGGPCTIDDCTLANCDFENCRFFHKPGARQSIFTSTNRIYACRQQRCSGIEGIL